MITLAHQRKTPSLVFVFRQFLLVMSCCAVGCQDGGSTSEKTTSPGVVASMNAAKPLPEIDGQLRGGVYDTEAASASVESVQAESGQPLAKEPVPALPSELLDGELSSELRDALQRIRMLRGKPVVEQGAAGLEVRRRRNFRIVEIATRHLPLAMQPGPNHAAFLPLIRDLLEARLELAVSGGQADIQTLYADVKALTDRDAQSAEAAEGVYTLARFSHEMARRHGSEEPDWYHCFVRWSQEFAGRFPEQSERAVALLLGSARSCELQSLETDDGELASRLRQAAIQCHELLVSGFGETSAASESTAALRRMKLPETELLQFSGRSLSGESIDCSQFVDVVTVIYFWDSRDPEFTQKLLPLLQQADEVSNGQLRFVGVCLNDHSAQVNDFLQRHHVPGDQIVGTDEQRSGWNHPLVRFWGISRGATCWLVDRDQTVAAVDVTAKDLVGEMRRLFRPTE